MLVLASRQAQKKARPPARAIVLFHSDSIPISHRQLILLALVRAGSVFIHRSGPPINIFPLDTRVKLGPIIEPETEGEARAKAAKGYEHVMDTLREIDLEWHKEDE